MRTSDWSSDVCSSDLPLLLAAETLARPRLRRSGPETAVRAGQRRDHRAGRAHRLCGGAAAAAADGRLHERTAFRILAAATRSRTAGRSEGHTSELQSLMRNSYAVFCLKKTQQT